jgi:hypothetical protein
MTVIPTVVGSIKWEDGLGKKQDPISKINRARRVRSMAHMVECLPSKQKNFIKYFFSVGGRRQATF